MLNPSDKELDHLSREAAERFEVDEEISSWEKLSANLDTELGIQGPRSSQRKNAKRILYGLFLLLLLSIGYLVFGPSKHNNGLAKTSPASVTSSSANGQNTSPGKNKTIVTAPIEEKTLSATSKKNIKSLETPADNSLPSAAAKTGVKPTAVTSAQVTNPASLAKTGPAESNPRKNINTASPIISGYKPGYVAKTKSEKTSSSNHQLLNGSSSNRLTLSKRKSNAKNISGNDTRIPGNSYNKISISEKELSLSTVETPGPLTEPGLYAINGSLLPALTLQSNSSNSGSKVPAVVKQKSSRARPLTIGLLFAPDVSNVNSFKANKISANIGLTIGYHLSDRLSVNSGLTLTRKNYAAEGKDFHPTNTWLNITGNCTMFEIPLTLRYDVSVNKKSRLFVNGGVSTYLMKREEYYYDYYYGGTMYHKDASYASHERNYLSILNLSAGIEHSLSKNLSLQVEPFVKLPLSGVGIGKLQLNSYGLSFSLRWSPVLKK